MKKAQSELLLKARRAWSAMKRRCCNPSATGFRYYGGRGIKVEGWASFDAFLIDVGLPPTLKHSIDRIDNNGNYRPGNCRWATSKEQARNTRRTVYVECNGRSVSIPEWSEANGIPYQRAFVLIKWFRLSPAQVIERHAVLERRQADGLSTKCVPMPLAVSR